METTLNKREAMYQKIEEHGNNLNAIFNTGLDPVVLCKKLLRIENKAHHATTCLCNTNTLDSLHNPTGWNLKESTEEEQDIFFGQIMDSVRKILKVDNNFPIFINFDPRGYALKIKKSYMIEHNLQLYRDWGGYGIIAPDFNN